MNFVNPNAMYGGAPCGAGSASEIEDDAQSVITEAERSRAWKRRHLHQIYRETLPHYRDPTSEWARQFTHTTLSNIWENYRNA